jgi:hypothetical protein
MGQALKCDRCGAMYPPSKGSAYIGEMGYCEGGDNEFATWGEIDFCPACATVVLQAIGAALDDNPVAAASPSERADG